MKKVYFALGLLSILFLMVAGFFVANRTLANALIDQTVGSNNPAIIPLANANLPKPILAISVEDSRISMKVTPLGLTAVTIYSRSDNGETRINIPIRMSDGTWFLVLPTTNFTPGNYTSYAVADAGTSVFGQSNMVSYVIKTPVSQTSTGLSTDTSIASKTGSNIIDPKPTGYKQPSIQQSEAPITTSGDQASSSSPNADQIASSQVAVDSTILPEKFVKSIEQIKSTNVMRSDNQAMVTIESVKNIELSSADTANSTNKKDAISFSGKAKPNSIIYLYIFSDPIVVSVKADENGNWQYILDRPLDTGKHESYVLIEDPQTKEILRTEAKSFFISKARAASSMLDIPGNKGIVLDDPFYGMIKNYIVYVTIVVGLAVLAILFFGLRKFRYVEADETDSESKGE